MSYFFIIDGIEHKISKPIKRLWKGKRRLFMPKFRNQYTLYEWALSIKVGDYVAVCDGCNRKVKEIKYIAERLPIYRSWKKIDACFDVLKCIPERRKGYYIKEIIMVDLNGNQHIFPGGGCVLPKETNEEIYSFHKEIGCDIRLDEFGEYC